MADVKYHQAGANPFWRMGHTRMVSTLATDVCGTIEIIYNTIEITLMF